MSVEIGTATDHANLLDLLDTFLTSQGMTLDPSFAGTGNGTIAGLIGGSASVAEMVTITFTDATHFDVALHLREVFLPGSFLVGTLGFLSLAS